MEQRGGPEGGKRGADLGWLRVLLRQEYIRGAEEESRRKTGRPLTAQELRRVLARYPGD
jgi:hypothetical protein